MRRLAALVILAAVGAAAQPRRVTLESAEQLWRAKRYEDASNAFKILADQEPKNPLVRVRWGRLFLERFNKAEAANLFQEALILLNNYPPALMGMALVSAEGFESKAVEFARKALEGDPKLVEAQELLARLALEDTDEKRAAEEAHKALKISDRALDAMAVLATIDWMNDRADTPWIGKILEKDPAYGEAYATAGYFLVLNRRYEEGIAFYRKALDLKPDLWSARSQLGVNLMRLGFEDEARKHLELCYENHYRDPATVNTLRLMDSYKNFVTVKTPTTILRLHKKEAELLRPYIQAELDRAMTAYEKKYQLKLNAPVQIEVYPDHEDFAVRTMAMPGLGALGVTFGNFVAMDSPSGRAPGTYHWASTLWHELSHVYVLAATKHRVPRWFTEGMAVYEETAASPDWGDRMDPHTIMAIKDKKLLPVAELDRGFVRPSYPGQVVISYFEAGRICGFIAKKWGYDKLIEMMGSYAAKMSTPEVIEKHLGLKPEAFDKEFLAALDAETGTITSGFDNWRKKLRATAEAAKAEKWDEVIRDGAAIRDLYPEYVEAGSAYEFLADAYVAKGDKKKAIEQLAAYSRAGGRNLGLMKRLATLLEEDGRKKEAAAALARLNPIYLNDEEVHRRLGELRLDGGDPLGAIAEFQAVVALKPIDPAGAHYSLARAYRQAGKMDDAREELVSALEAAPGFRPAQRLLLEISQGEKKP